MPVELRGRTVTVTGGAGLVGSFLVEHLVAAGARVIVVDDLSKGRLENLSAVIGAIEFRQADLEQEAAAADALSGADVVFHLASRAYGVGYSSKHHFEMLEHNERITNNLLHALRRRPPSHLLVTSSSCVYRDDGPDVMAELPLFDGEPERVNWGYGWAKRFLEQKAMIFAADTGVPVTVVRPFNIYGERYNWVGENSQAIPMLVKKVMDGANPVVIWGSGRQRRNYLHAIDCAAAMAGLVEAGHSATPVNIGTEDTVTVRELVELICRRGGVAPALTIDTTKPEGRFIKSADASRLRAALPGFRVSVDLQDGIDRMLSWYRRTFSGGPA